MFLLRRCLILVALFTNILALAQESATLSRQKSLKTQRAQAIAREAWFQRGRTLPGQSSATLRLRAYQQKLQMRNTQVETQLDLTAKDVIPQVWQPLGPSPLASDASGLGQQDYGWVSGRATSIVIDRADPSGNTVYVGGAFGGIWKSSNAGSASVAAASVVWTPLIDDQPTRAVGAIAIQPQSTNPDPSRSVVLVGTGEANSSTDSYHGLGILRSANGGATWSLISQDGSGTHPFAGLAFSKIAFSTVNPNLIVAAIAGASQGLIEGLANPPTPNLGIYYSTNSGITWNFASITDSGTTVPPGSVTSVVYNDTASLFIAAVRSHGFYSSSDGSHWSRLARRPGPGLSLAVCPTTTSANCPIYRGEIAAVAARNEMYVWYVDANENDQGIWKTPVNAVVVDPGPDPLSGTIYTGTDVGVFASSTSSAIWTEVGPSPGQSGFLPNVPVTALRIFNAGTTKLLRASTYGRGLWQFALSTAADFQVAVTDPIQTIFSSQTATFNAALTAIDGYNNSVSLSCAAFSTAPPTICTVSASPITPSGTFTITASGVPGDYSFKLHAVGAPPSSIVHDVPVTLHIIDFNLTAPTPSGISVDPGDNSQPVTFQVTAQEGFQANVNLSCSGLPTGTTCNFSPSNVISPTANTPVAITLTISTTNNTLPGTFSAVIHGSASGSPDKTQNLTLVVGKRDYALTITNPALTGVVNTASVFNGSLSTANGYSSSVSLSCGTGAPPTCTVSPSTLTPSAGGTAFTVTVQSNVTQNYSFNIVAQGSDVLAISHSSTVSFQIFDFSFTVTPDSQKVPAGQSAKYTLDMVPDGGKFVTAVNFSCANLPVKTSCSFNPPQIIAGGGETPVQLNISTTAATAAVRQHTSFLYAFWLPLVAFSFLSIKMPHIRRKILLFVALLMVLPHLGCGGGGLQGNGNGGGNGGGGNSQPGTTPGTYIITVTAAAGSVTHSSTMTLTVQ